MLKKQAGLICLSIILLFVLTSCGSVTPQASVANEPIQTNTISNPTTTPIPVPTGTPTPVPTGTPTSTPTKMLPAIKVCQITDTGGIQDNSINSGIWRGISKAMELLNVNGKYVEQRTPDDLVKYLDTLSRDGCNLIIGIGYNAYGPFTNAAKANPDIHFLLVDTYHGSEIVPNLAFASANLDEGVFLAGYLAAAVAVQQAGPGGNPKVATFGGMAIPSDTGPMKAFAMGVDYYNTQKKTEVKTLGWDLSNPSAAKYLNSYADESKGKAVAEQFIQEGASVIFPLAGMGSLGAIKAANAVDNVYIVGNHTDWFVAIQNTSKVMLTSVVINYDNLIFNYLEAYQNGAANDREFIGSLSDGVVGLAPYHNLEYLISPELQAELEAVKAEIVAGNIIVE